MAFQIKQQHSSNFKNNQIRDKKYLKLIRLLQCAVSGKTGSVEAAHIRYVDMINYPNKQNAGTGLKPGDNWVLPLLAENHRTGLHAQHNTGHEEDWWHSYGFDPLALCEKLYNDGNYNLISMKSAMRDHFQENRQLLNGYGDFHG